jgi:hypothetical protein
MKQRINGWCGSLALVFCFLLFSCKSPKPSTTVSIEDTPQSVSLDSLLVGIKREACFGRCPQYTATIYKSGWAEYYGEMNVKKVGAWHAKLSEEQQAYLIQAIRQNKMEAMDTSYSNPYLADFPAYALWISVNKPRKKILVNHESPPTEIKEFTQVLEELLDQLRWVQHPKARKDEE